MGSGRKRRRRSGEMGRVAEIVMVLAAAGQARGAGKLTAAEARERLLGKVAAAALRPRELFTRGAVRALVEELGLTRARDPSAMGYRPRRASIAQRVLLTKRKMEQIKGAQVYPTTKVPQTAALSTTAFFHHVASKSTTGLPMNMSADASFPATTPANISSPNILKQTQLNESPSGASSVKADGVSSIVSLPSVGSTNTKVEKGVNSPNHTQNGATVGQANKSANHTATMSSPNSEGSSSNAGTHQHKKAPVIQPITVDIGLMHQSQPGASFVQQQSIFSNHNAIAKLVQQVLHQPVNNPNWTPPSTGYMHSRLDCQVCKVSIIDTPSVIVCDACERGIHLKCLHRDGINVLPKAEWYCPTCVARSQGKSLPPKYGRVTRTVDAPKVNITSGVTSQGVSENSTTKDNSQELAEDGTVFNKNEIVTGNAKDVTNYSIGCSSVGWVGDPLKVAENKTYYSSCSIDGISYNLEDHILIASKDKEFAPSKLQSLWEEHDSRSKMALVSPYFFASDIPESIRKPCTAEENEVFASYDQRTVTVSVICGPCEVLHVDKFREVSKRSQVVSSELHPIFLCRWKYDESTSCFSSIDS